MGKLRVEEPGTLTVAPTTPIVLPVPQVDRPKPTLVDVNDLDHWRKLAVATGERLAYAERQAQDLRQAADDARSRHSKYKGRLDTANNRINELQCDLVRVTAERDDVRHQLHEEVTRLRSQLVDQAVVAKKIHEFRQSILNGSIWDLFTEFVVSPQDAGGEQA